MKGFPLSGHVRIEQPMKELEVPLVGSAQPKFIKPNEPKTITVDFEIWDAESNQITSWGMEVKALDGVIHHNDRTPDTLHEQQFLYSLEDAWKMYLGIASGQPELFDLTFD